MKFFSGPATSVYNIPHYVFLLLSKTKNNNEIKNAFPVQNIIIDKGNAVPLGRCGPLQAMSGSLIIHVSISGWMDQYFPLFCLVFEPQQHYKFYTSVMKSNLLNVQMLSLSSFMA